MPLKGVKVIEVVGLAPSPHCGMILSDFGANVLRVERPGNPLLDALQRGKRTATIDLKKEAGKTIFKRLCSDADVLLEPFRPGVMERLGLGPKPMLDLNKRLIYARLTGFGQDGCYAKRAGHDINYLAMSGVLSRLTSNNRPVAPLNLLADFAGGGMTCTIGILLALIERNKSNLGQVVDVSMVEGVSYLASYLWQTQKKDYIMNSFIWPERESKETNLLDGGAHFYTVYETKDGRWMSVGAIEPQFYAAFLNTLQLSEDEFPHLERQKWPELKRKIAEVFKSRTFAEWIELFESSDACVEPILEDHEARAKLAEVARNSFNEDGTPKPAPLLSRTPARSNLREPQQDENTVEVLREHGFTMEEIGSFLKEGVISCAPNSKL